MHHLPDTVRAQGCAATFDITRRRDEELPGILDRKHEVTVGRLELGRGSARRGSHPELFSGRPT